MSALIYDCIHYRIGNLELRDNHAKTLEIVRWEDGQCWTLLSFQPDKSTGAYQVQFVGDRPLDDGVNWHHLRHLIKAGYGYFAVYQEESE